MGLLDRDPFARPVAPAPVEPDPWVRVLAALDQLRAAIVDAPTPPAPIIKVAPVDLSEVVMAVQALKGPVSAEEIAVALASVLRPGSEADAGVVLALAKVVEKLDELSFRMKGRSVTTGGGFASMTVNGAPVTAANPMPTSTTTEATYLENRYGGGKTPVPFTVTASGDTTIHTPAAGKAVRLFSITAITDPDQATTPLIKVLIGSTEKTRGHAVSGWEIRQGAADEALKINLSETSSVSGTAYIKEFTP